MDLQGLYDMVGFTPEKEDAFEEARFKKAIENNRNFGRRNKEMFIENKDCYLDCPRYNPCPICDKCQNKASHLYVKCQLCQIPICTHKYHDRELMIRRNNFVLKVTKETMDKLDAQAEKVRQGEFNNENK